MTPSYWFDLRNVFIYPAKAARALRDEQRLSRVSWISYSIGVLSYAMIVYLGYSAIGLRDFPHRVYYPHYFSPCWWEFFVLPVWGGVLALGYAVPAYLMARLLGGQGTWRQTLALVLLASVVSVPVSLIVDAWGILRFPELRVAFAKYGPQGVTPDMYRGEVFRVANTWYAYVSMAWQGIATGIGLAAIHRTKWY
jgi:hypothetical protein